jgi:hypothetical protein
MADRSKVDEFMNVLPQFARVKTLTLYTASSLAPQGVRTGLSGDVDYDGARAIMTKLHAQKVGAQCNSIEIHLNRHNGYSVNRENDFRSFSSKMSISGVYEQWGSKRKIAPKVSVASASN